MKRFILGSLVLLAAPQLRAAVLVVNTSVNTVVPDDSSTGIYNEVNVATTGTVTGVSVGLNLGAAAGSQAFLGDLYAYLQHGSTISVLLNRPGRRSGESLGYDDNQSLNVSFADGGTDIHNYRTVLNGNDTTPLTGALTGSWAPDGRATDPSAVLATDSRTSQLNGFNGVPLQGDWRLFVADLSGGAVHEVNDWTLTMNYAPVPEPALAAGLTALGLGVFGFVRRRRAAKRN